VRHPGETGLIQGARPSYFFAMPLISMVPASPGPKPASFLVLLWYECFVRD